MHAFSFAAVAFTVGLLIVVTVLAVSRPTATADRSAGSGQS
jgi:hypothetical protein